VLKDATIK